MPHQSLPSPHSPNEISGALRALADRVAARGADAAAIELRGVAGRIDEDRTEWGAVEERLRDVTARYDGEWRSDEREEIGAIGRRITAAAEVHRRSRQKRVLGLPITTILLSLLLGVAYGIAARYTFNSDPGDENFEIMSISFFLLIPIVSGFIPIFLWPAERKLRTRDVLLVPWAIALLTLGTAMALALEGMVCVIIWAPLFLVCATVGGGIGALARHVRMARPSRGLVLTSILIIPYVISPLEQRYEPTPQLDAIENSIIIEADAATIWENIRAVPPIGADEYESTFTHAIGFPKPIAATIDRDGIGAVRHATFEGGVVFTETITEWEPLERLSFTIDPSADIPPTTFDEHVVVGGKYFDVLTGSYRLERLGERRYRLHLRSEHRLGTRFNWYTRIWTRLFMGEIQESILGVVKGRCEGVREGRRKG